MTLIVNNIESSRYQEMQILFLSDLQQCKLRVLSKRAIILPGRVSVLFHTITRNEK